MSNSAAGILSITRSAMLSRTSEGHSRNHKVIQGNPKNTVPTPTLSVRVGLLLKPNLAILGGVLMVRRYSPMLQATRVHPLPTPCWSGDAAFEGRDIKCLMRVRPESLYGSRTLHETTPSGNDFLPMVNCIEIISQDVYLFILHDVPENFYIIMSLWPSFTRISSH